MRINLALATAAATLIAAPALADGGYEETEAATSAATMDTDGDGRMDGWDRDRDGRADAWDTDGDDMPDRYDDDGDGEMDADEED
ncbi:MAG: hypothetical protein WA906_09430 [Pacificimonas sp.]